MFFVFVGRLFLWYTFFMNAQKRKREKKFLSVARKATIFVLLTALAMPFVRVYAEDGSDMANMQDEAQKITKKIQKEKKQLDGLTQNLQIINGNLSATQSAIQTTKTHIQTTQETISRKEAEIERLEQLLEEQKGTLQEVLQLLYDVSQTPAAEMFFRDSNVSQFLNGSEEVMTIQDQIKTIVENSLQTKEKIETERGSLVGFKQEKEKLLVSQGATQKNLLADKRDTQSDIEDKKETIEELQKKLAELQKDINALTGKSYNAKDIREAVDFASDATGVPAKVLYGFLKVETNLGANTGQCTYDQVEKDAIKIWYGTSSKWKASRDLLKKRRGLFEDLVDKLGYDTSKKVSCTPRSYRGQGGAMGVSQFMSDVWLGYASSVSAKTGHGTPDPWNLTDGVTAMAIKLRNAGVTSSSSSAIKKGVANYLGAASVSYYNGVVSGMQIYDMKN